jgi:Basic region leucine zipper
MALDESNTANILLCLSMKSSLAIQAEADDDFPFDPLKGNIIDQLRSKVRAEAAMQISLVSGETIRDSQDQVASSSSSSSGAATRNDVEYSSAPIDGDGNSGLEDLSDGSEFDELESMVAMSSGKDWRDDKQLEHSAQELESMRKERNRMHAKLTRDRKKLFTSRLQQTIKSLERQNLFMRKKLQGLLLSTDPG